jgi:hypothetical protein
MNNKGFLCPAISQLRGKAGKRQVAGVKIGLAHSLGGEVTDFEAGAVGVRILTR